jgi:hypothetical protein
VKAVVRGILMYQSILLHIRGTIVNVLITYPQLTLSRALSKDALAFTFQTNILIS